VPAGDLGHGGGREMGQNGEETEGISFPCSPWVEAAWGGGSAARFGRRRELMVAARLEAVVEQGRLLRFGCGVWSDEGLPASIYRRG
jgi:hypothetical protein